MSVVPALTPEGLLAHWQGHRRLTRRTIEAFPDEELFGFTAGGMRSFGAIMDEVVSLTEPLLHGAATGEWSWPPRGAGTGSTTREALLEALERADAAIAETLPRVAPERFLAHDTPVPGRTESVIATLLYFIDNEVHHRGQGYVYLRLLAIEPPPFYVR
jgi:uncharacterized damage-inducible protein DinB